MKGKKILNTAIQHQDHKPISLSNTLKPIQPSNKLMNKAKGNESTYSNVKILKKLSNENIDNKEQSKHFKSKQSSLRPSSNRKKTIEKIEIECDTDRIEDNEYFNSLSKNELEFYRNQTSALYHFLFDINLVRFIDDFIQEGFETEDDLLLIKEDYFEENNAFDHIQQKKILDKVKEMKIRKTNRPKKETCEFGTNTNKDDHDVDNKTLPVKRRCWNCYKPINDNSGTIKEYHNGLIDEKMNFCSEKCMKDFEKNIIYVQCKECNNQFDKAKGDFVIDNNHYCSKKCINAYLTKKNQITQYIRDDIDGDNDTEYQYDPMEDF